MTQTEIYDQIQRIHEDEKQQLLAALQSHGGSYSWSESYRDGGEYPQIDVRRRTFNGNVEEIDVLQASIIGNFTMLLEGYSHRTCHIVSFSSDDALVGELIGIINYMQ